MVANRRASSVSFGFDFQMNAAIVLMLENIEELSSLRLEGNYEDIEIKLNDGKYILAQAKAVVRACSDFTNVRRNLEKSLISLSEGAQKCNAKELILITNSINPLNDEAKQLFELNGRRTFEWLPESSKKLVLKFIEKNRLVMDVNKFKIQVFSFETDDKIERYKYVRKVIDDFIGELNISIPGLVPKVMDVWQNQVLHNSTKDDAQIVLSKNDIIWPIMLIVTDINRMDDELVSIIDPSIYDDVIYKYEELIVECCERCEFFIKVLSDYQLYKTSKNISEKILDFVESKWKDYEYLLSSNNDDEEIRKALVQIILFCIITNRISIQKIKAGVGL